MVCEPAKGAKINLAGLQLGPTKRHSRVASRKLRVNDR